MCTLYNKNQKIGDEIKLIIFDKDGTLIDLHHYWLQMIFLRTKHIANQIALPPSQEGEIITTMGGDTTNSCLLPDGPIGIYPREYIVEVTTKKLRSLGHSIENADIENFFKQADKESARDISPFVKILPGVRSFLEKAHSIGIRLAIATTDLTERAILCLKSVEILDKFDLIIGGDRITNKKPAPDCGNLILKHFNITPEHCVMIGDHRVDIQMGQSCNMISIGVTTGLSKYSELVKYTPHIIESFENLDIRND